MFSNSFLLCMVHFFTSHMCASGSLQAMGFPSPRSSAAATTDSDGRRPHSAPPVPEPDHSPRSTREHRRRRRSKDSDKKRRK